MNSNVIVESDVKVEIMKLRRSDIKKEIGQRHRKNGEESVRLAGIRGY